MSIWQNIYTHHPTVLSTTMAAIVALFVAVIGIKKQRQISREKNSLDFEANYKSSQEIRNAWNNLKDIRNKETSFLANLISEPKNEYRADLLLILNEWERASNAMFHKIYDENLLYKAYGSIVIDLFSDFSPFIRECQLIKPRAFIYVTKLAVSWQLRRANEVDISKQLVINLKEVHAAAETLFTSNSNYLETKQSLENLKEKNSNFNNTLKRLK